MPTRLEQFSECWDNFQDFIGEMTKQDETVMKTLRQFGGGLGCFLLVQMMMGQLEPDEVARLEDSSVFTREEFDHFSPLEALGLDESKISVKFEEIPPVVLDKLRRYLLFFYTITQTPSEESMPGETEE